MNPFSQNNYQCSLFWLFFAETFSLTTEPGWFSVLSTRLSAQSGRVQSMFRHVQLRRAAVSFVSSQLRPPRPRSSLCSGLCPSAKQGLGPGWRLWKRCPVALWTLSTQRPHQVERGRGLRVHPLAARSRDFFYLTGAQRKLDICAFCPEILIFLFFIFFYCLLILSSQVVRKLQTSFALKR